jgi:hypothetical protein
MRETSFENPPVCTAQAKQKATYVRDTAPRSASSGIIQKTSRPQLSTVRRHFCRTRVPRTDPMIDTCIEPLEKETEWRTSEDRQLGE